MDLIVTTLKSGYAFAKYMAAAGRALREKHWAALWEHFWDDTDTTRREVAIAKLGMPFDMPPEVVACTCYGDHAART